MLLSEQRFRATTSNSNSKYIPQLQVLGKVQVRGGEFFLSDILICHCKCLYRTFLLDTASSVIFCLAKCPFQYTMYASPSTFVAILTSS
jgi:hypothetical protein